jgi:glycosyltransferase involved in cell wall biosynthesis
MNKTIFIIAPYPQGQAPSQRFRFEQYLDFLEQEGFTIEQHSFLSNKTWSKLYESGTFFHKAAGMFSSFWRRFLLLFKMRTANYVFIHREASMIGPPIFEWIIAKVLRKKYIYDFDDAIWLPNYSKSNAKFHRLKAYWKIKRILKWAHVVSAGNDYLKKYAEQYAKNVILIPTTIDLQRVHNILTDHNSDKINIGWTGTHTTMGYLDKIIPILKDIEKEHAFTFTVISNQKPNIELDSFQFVQWSKETEIQDLSSINIGVMPLEEDKWALGKCGFKGLQYMALEIPAVVSDIGVNKDIIINGHNGFLCETPQDWKDALVKLITDKSLRARMGKNGRETVFQKFSVEANKNNYLKLFSS